MNQGAALKKKKLNPNKAQSPMKNIGFDFQCRSSAELARTFQIKREKLTNDRNDKVKEQEQLTHKRKNLMPATSRELQSKQRVILSEESVQMQERSKLPVRRSMIQSSPKEALNTSRMISTKGLLSKQPLIQSEESIPKKRTSELPIHKSMKQSSSKDVLNTTHMKRAQNEGEEHLNIQELQNCKKVKRQSVLRASSLDKFLEKQGIHIGSEKQPDLQPVNDDRFISSPPVDEHNVELDDFAEQEEVGEEEYVGDEAMDIDCATGTSEKKKVRGQTTCKNIHARSFEEREEVTFDKGQAVAPTSKRVSDLTNFIGTIARNPRFITLVYTSWHAVPGHTKKRMWEYVNSKFIIPAEGKKWVMDGLRDAWKGHKRRIKKKHFDDYETIEEMLENRPNDIPEVQFRQLIEYWKLPTIQAMCRLNSENRKKQKWRHRMGPVNFAKVRVALRKKNNQEPSKSEMFIATRTKEGKEVYTDSQIAISELLNRQDSGETSDEAFKAVFGKEQPGRVRCYGRSVTTTYLQRDEEINKLKQKHANEMTSLKEEMKEMLRSEMRNFVSQLVQNNPGLNIQDIPGCIGSNIPSPVDVGSARAGRSQNLPLSSGSTHAPTREKENASDTNGNCGRKSI